MGCPQRSGVYNAPAAADAQTNSKTKLAKLLPSKATRLTAADYDVETNDMGGGIAYINKHQAHSRRSFFRLNTT